MKKQRDKAMKLVLLDRDSLGQDLDYKRFEELGEFTSYPYTVQEDVPERIQEADVVITNKLLLGKKEMEAAEYLKLVCVTATGINNIDTQYAAKKGVRVANVVGYATESVAGHTLAMLLYLYGNISSYSNYRGGHGMGSKSLELSNKTWGIVGFGNIGRRVAALAQAFGCRVIFFSASGGAEHSGYERVSFDTLLTTCDIISIHAPLTDRTENLFDENAFAKMKKHAVLINTGRGAIVNEKALVQALEEDKIMAAALDVLAKEPISGESPYLYLKKKEKLLITPHIGWASVEARKRMLYEVCENIKAFQNGTVRNIVNQGFF